MSVELKLSTLSALARPRRPPSRGRSRSARSAAARERSLRDWRVSANAISQCARPTPARSPARARRNGEGRGVAGRGGLQAAQLRPRPRAAACARAAARRARRRRGSSPPAPARRPRRCGSGASWPAFARGGARTFQAGRRVARPGVHRVGVLQRGFEAAVGGEGGGAQFEQREAPRGRQAARRAEGVGRRGGGLGLPARRGERAAVRRRPTRIGLVT